MKPRKPPLPVLIALLVAAAGIAGWLLWQRSADAAALLADALPPRPALDNRPQLLRERIDKLESAFRAGEAPLRALGELSAVYHANGFYAEAAHIYTVLEQLDPDNPTWPHRHAVILAGFGQAESALPRFERVIALAPRHLPAHLRRADLLLKLNRLEDARAAYRETLEHFPNDPYALLGLARCDFEQQRWEDARLKLERVLALSNERLGYDLIVTVYQQLGMQSRADAIRGRAKASGAYRDPPDPWIEILYDDCYDVYRLSMAAGEAMDRDDPQLAMRRLERAIEIAPDNGSLHFQLAAILQAQGALSQARGHLERCTSLAPDFSDGWAHLVDLLARLGRSREADQALAAGLAHCPDSPGLHLTHARRLLQKGDVEGAVGAFRQSIALRPNEADTYIELASLFFKLDRVDEGVATLHQALEAEPDNPAALSTLAYHAIISGNRPAADRWLREAIDQPRIDREQIANLKTAYRQRFGESFR